MRDIDLVNATLRVYLGSETGGYQPLGDPRERVRRAFPDDHTSRSSLIATYLDEDMVIDWDATSLDEAGDLFAEVLRQKYPELDAISVRGLASRMTYVWWK